MARWFTADISSSRKLQLHGTPQTRLERKQYFETELFSFAAHEVADAGLGNAKLLRRLDLGELFAID